MDIAAGLCACAGFAGSGYALRCPEPETLPAWLPTLTWGAFGWCAILSTIHLIVRLVQAI